MQSVSACTQHFLSSSFSYNWEEYEFYNGQNEEILFELCVSIWGKKVSVTLSCQKLVGKAAILKKTVQMKCSD